MTEKLFTGTLNHNQNKIKTKISIKDIIRGPNGGLILVILGAQGGAKIKKLFKIKVEALIQIKIYCIKVVFINHIYIIQL